MSSGGSEDLLGDGGLSEKDAERDQRPSEAR